MSRQNRNRRTSTFTSIGGQSKESTSNSNQTTPTEKQHNQERTAPNSPNSIHASTGYDYLASIAEPSKMNSSDEESWEEPVAFNKQQRDSELPLRKISFDDRQQSIDSMEGSFNLDNIGSSGLHRHSTLGSLTDVAQSLSSKKSATSYIGPRHGRHSTLSSFPVGSNGHRRNGSSDSTDNSSKMIDYDSAHSSDSKIDSTKMVDNDSTHTFGSNRPPSSLKRGRRKRNTGVSFADQVLSSGRNKVRDESNRSMTSIVDPSDEMKGSEQLFKDPKRHSRHVNFSITQNTDSLAVELAELEAYLETLKQSVGETKRSMNITNLSDSIGSTIDKNRPGLNSASHVNNPKSRRRFSMAYRTTDEVVTFPDDCFSFLIVHGPIDSPYFFFFGLFISMLQMGFLTLALLSMVHPQWTATGSTDNPFSYFFYFPSNVTIVMRLTQILAVVSYCLFADMSVKDYLTAIDLFPQYSKCTKDDKYWCMVFSCVLRFTMGFMTVVVTLIMLLTNTSVIDTILDFLAMNFISDIGKMAFQLCLWGKYGRRLEAEARRLEDAELPRCMLRPPSEKRYRLMVTPMIVMAMSFLVALMVAQANDSIWTTKTVRVQIHDNPDLAPYSGCYHVNSHRDTLINNRMQYDASEENLEFARLGYCYSAGKWYLFNSDHNKPCEAEREELLLQSSITSDFDINGAKSLSWFDTDGTPVTMQFFMDSESEIEETCGSFLYDGYCDEIFNNYERDYDGGDCCASTCTKSNCGVMGLQRAFGTSISFGDGFPNCRDPSMVPITIKIENIIDSYTYYQQMEQRQRNTNGTDSEDSFLQHSNILRPSFLEPIKPIEPIMILDCDDRNILTVHINDKMEGQTETVMVEDGANCTVRINNVTSSSIDNENPIWYVNYTVYHGNEIDMDEKPIVILREHSANEEYANFARVPDCYFRKLSDYLDVSTIYTGSGPRYGAIRWLLAHSKISKNSHCEDDYFIERYALSYLNFAAPLKFSGDDTFSDISFAPVGVIGDIDVNMSIGDATFESSASTPSAVESTRVIAKDRLLWIEDTRQCVWRTVSCEGRTVDVLDLGNWTLEGTIASSIGMLPNLSKFDMSSNRLTGPIPTEIGLLRSLRALNIASNSLSGTLPVEIGNATALEGLTVADNDLEGTIPTEIGLLTSVKALNLTNNFFSGTIPSEIGLMTSLTVLDLSDNMLTGEIPREIGGLAMLHKLTKLYVANNADLVKSLDILGPKRDVLYLECPIDNCTLRQFDEQFGNSTVTMPECTAWLKKYEVNRQQLPMSVCESLKSKCMVCS